MLFDWIRKRTRNAVLDGINDAIVELEARQRPIELPEVRLALPGVEVEGEPKARSRKAGA